MITCGEIVSISLGDDDENKKVMKKKKMIRKITIGIRIGKRKER